MAPAPPRPRSSGYSRRAVLGGLGTTALVLGGSPAVRAATTTTRDEEVPQRVVVPAVQEFEDNYEGQFLVIFDPPAEPDASVQDVQQPCEEMPWPAERTRAMLGQLSDRRSENPFAVEVPVFVDEQDANLVENAFMVISDASPCRGNEYVRLDVEWITIRAVVGEPAGPTVQEDEPQALEEQNQATGEDGPGYGLLAAVVGLSGGLLARRRYGD